jgi:protocatechuate 3,4-dioxygenase beta subunit
MEEATSASLLGPFFRENTPQLEHGASIAKMDKGGQEVVLYGRVTNAQGQPLPNAMLTVWQTAADGRYDIQNSLEEIDCRGIFFADANGNYLVRTVRPLGYYIPLDGPVGQMVLAQKRHGMRPAHIHFLVAAPGYRELVTALYLAGDQHLEDDVVFGASGDLVVEVKDNDPASPVKGLPSVHFDFSLARETEADRKAGRVGADPAQVTRATASPLAPTAPLPRRLSPPTRRRAASWARCSASRGWGPSRAKSGEEGIRAAPLAGLGTDHQSNLIASRSMTCFTADLWGLAVHFELSTASRLARYQS